MPDLWNYQFIWVVPQCLAIKLSYYARVKRYSASNIYPSVQMGKGTDNRPQALIIDDEVDICYLLKGILRQKNIIADHVSSLKEAEDFLKEADPPVIFLDNHLSDGLGMNYIRQLKRQHPSTKVIMITAHDTAYDRELAYKEGVDFFISKPFSREIILKTIEKIDII